MVEVKKQIEKEIKIGIKKGIVRGARDFVKNSWDEIFQLFILGTVLGISKEEKMAKEKVGKKDETPTEKMLGSGGRMFHAFTHEDDIKWNRLFAAVREICNGEKCEEKFMKFLHFAIEKGYDEDTLRIRLIGSFSRAEEKDPAIQTVKTIADLDRKRMKQIEFAKNRKLLVKKSLKNSLLWIKNHKVATVLWIIAGFIVLGWILD